MRHPEKATRSQWDITALVRNADKAKILQSQFGVKTVVGTLQEYDRIAELAEQSHVVLNIVSGIPYSTGIAQIELQSL